MTARVSGRQRPGAATAELAVVTPLLVFLLLVAIDYARVFYTALTLDNCARNAAMWEANPYDRAESKYKTVQEAAAGDAADLYDPGRPLVVDSVSGVDTDGRLYVEVSVSQKFQTVTKFPGIPDDMTIKRTVRMAKVPPYPK